jgi:hypothetical protein
MAVFPSRLSMPGRVPGWAHILIKLLGWHWAFLPTFAAELVPGLDLFPTWTTAVFFATRQMNSAPEPDVIDHDRKRTTEPEILDPGPAPARRV